MLRTIFVATPNLEFPAGFGQVMHRVAALYGARLIIACVRRPSQLGGLELPPLNSFEDPNAPAPLRGRVQNIVLAGEFTHAVCDKGHEADVIVVWHQCLVGPDGKPSADDLSNLVRHAPRPVWLFREPLICPEHILVAYDGSAHSGRALHLAANLAETMGARLTVVHVDESRDEVARERILLRAAGYCEPYRINMERVGLFGRAAESIQSYVEVSGCDLLIVGAAGVGYLRGLLFGSVAGQLIANARCSVLVAK
jgi:nucleotide-binding universal stress UspA family protein